MAGRGRPKREDVDRPLCPWPSHKKRDVALHGAVKGKDGTVTRRRYLWSPGTTKEHSFFVPVEPVPSGLTGLPRGLLHVE